MNSKKARSCRQLVRQLIDKSGQDTPWVKYTAERQPHAVLPTIYKTEALNQQFNKETIEETHKRFLEIASVRGRYIVKTLNLDPSCGRAIYKQVKRSQSIGHASA